MTNEEINQAYADYEADYRRREEDILSKIYTIRGWLDEITKFIEEKR